MSTAAQPPHRWTAVESLVELRAGRIGALELLDHYLARQAALDGPVNAVVATDPEGARRAARDIDARRARGETLPPLAGLPMTIKDSFEVVGLPATCGIPDLAQYRPQRDADAVARLRAAGAVIYGKTNCPLGAADHQSYNPVYGLTRNPWNPARTVGGSSGGAAAALAAGFCALELGSDIGGSIRVPSHYCGVYGHKPSWGIVSGRGHIPPMPGEVVPPPPLAVVGPIARSAADLDLALELLAGPAQDDAVAWSLRLPAPRHESLRDYRVGLWLDAYPVDDAYASAIENFARTLADAGVRVELLHDGPVDPAASWAIYLDLLFGVIGSGSPESELAAYRAAADGAAEDSYAARLGRATAQPLRHWVARSAQQAQLRRQWSAFFRRYDLLVCPVAMGPAFPHQVDDGHGPVPQLKRTLPVNGAPRPYLDNLMWSGLVTVAHLPSTVIPLATSLDGLPLGVQAVGPYLEDRSTIRFAALSQERLGAFRTPAL
jgi:amidase